jgi:exopolyphosphatase/guanosine-5'-triphosphate,3'-diphosphate pyrophosphatase
VRVAAVDLGTNTTRLLVADVDDGRLTEVARRTVITRMGEAVDEGHAILPTAIARVRRALDGYRREAEALGAEQVLAVATSAMRDAANGEALLGEIERSYGFTTRLLTGDEEAALGFRGTALGREIAPATLIVDIGGGSTELVLAGPGGVVTGTSTQLGCVRLTERFLHSDPPAAAELEACAAHVRAGLPALRPAAAIGVSGTVTTAAAIDIGEEPYDPLRVHGRRIGKAVIEQELAALSALPLVERERVRCLEPARAPVIVAGLVILLEILGAYGLDEIEASERDILHGTALAAAELPTRADSTGAPPGNTRRRA